ncbi:MAG: TraB/GumN family protein [Hyphococcus sp.]
MTARRKSFSAIARVAALGAALFAAAPAAKAQAPAADVATPAMWRVADADSTFILLGTFHILPPDLEWRSALLDRALQEADAVYFEVEADAPIAPAIVDRFLNEKGVNPPGIGLSSALEKNDSRALHRIVRSLGLSVKDIEAMRPWRAFLTLSVQFIIDQGFQPGAGVDSVLLAEARNQKKDIRFFETLEQQLDFFASLEPRIERDLLVITIRNWENEQEMFDDLFNAWRTGDAAAIDAQMNDTMREQAPDVYERLIVERNEAWAAEIAEAIDSGSGQALVAVGAGHLVGEAHSVPALLRKKGFDVSRYDGTGPAANDNTPADEIESLLQDIEAQQ